MLVLGRGRRRTPVPGRTAPREGTRVPGGTVPRGGTWAGHGGRRFGGRSKEAGTLIAGLFNSPGQRALEGRLATLIAGRSVLADEIANLDTPGYRAQDAGAFASSLAASLGAQLGATPGPAGTVAPVAPVAPATSTPQGAGAAPLALTGAAPGAGTGVVTPNGNGMDLDALMAGLGKTDLDYQAVSRQLQLTYQNLRDAIDVGGA